VALTEAMFASIYRFIEVVHEFFKNKKEVVARQPLKMAN
jgi:hypothetical protein